jgi:hypothetical protein
MLLCHPSGVPVEQVRRELLGCAHVHGFFEQSRGIVFGLDATLRRLARQFRLGFRLDIDNDRHCCLSVLHLISKIKYSDFTHLRSKP